MADRFLEESLVKALGPTLGNDNIGSILLILEIFCLGMLYVCTRYSMTETNVSPITFVAWRFIVSLAYLVLLQIVTNICQLSLKTEIAHPPSAAEQIKSKQYWYDLFLWGSLVGAALLGLTIGIQFGESTESAGKTAFITGINVVVIPFAEMALTCFSYNLPWKSWLAIAIDVPGIFILSGCTQTNCFNNFQWGTFYIILAMLFIVAHTMLTARGMAAVGTTPIIIFSFLFCAVASTILALIFETEDWVYPFTQLTENWGIVLLSSLFEFLMVVFLTVALGIISTSRAAIVMSLESLSGAFCGYIFLGEVSFTVILSLLVCFIG